MKSFITYYWALVFLAMFFYGATGIYHADAGGVEEKSNVTYIIKCTEEDK